MTIFSTILLFALSLSAKADNVLLECYFNIGPDQQVQIVQPTSNTLILRELTNYGGWVTRELSWKEWDEKRIRLRSEDGSRVILSKEGSRWRYQGAGVDGYADCY